LLDNISFITEHEAACWALWGSRQQAQGGAGVTSSGIEYQYSHDLLHYLSQYGLIPLRNIIEYNTSAFRRQYHVISATII
jgi:hypothetical protein